ncbi:MAG: hypothetical protein K8F62_01305 [Pseudorhodoplanes sp.]|nr:hypothetical protein [Pseudorhodoplanes sp.]
MQASNIRLVVNLIAVMMLCASSRGLAGTPEAAQRAGLVSSVLRAFVIAEFGGRTLSNPHYNKASVCIGKDYEDLREATKDNVTLVAFHSRCRLVETKVERLHVHAFAYLPSGYCEPIKKAIETMLAEHIYSVPAEQQLPDKVVEYKGIRIDRNGAYWNFVRSSKLSAICQDDGSLRLTGTLRKPAGTRVLPFLP